MNRQFSIVYRVVAPYNRSFTPVEYKTRNGARNYIARNSKHNIPFDPEFLTIETRPKF